MFKSMAAAAGMSLLAAHAFAQPCLDNFTVDGNFFAGKTYKTWADLPGVPKRDAFSRAQAFTAENGFSILSADADAGVLSAAQSVSYGKGKTVPLSVTVQEDGGSLRVTMSYATSGGVVSPEEAIKRHFCMTIAAMGQAAAGGGAAPAPAAAPPQRPAAQAAQAAHSTPGFAPLTGEQQDAIATAIPRNVPNDSVGATVKEAAPAIAEFVGKLACLSDRRSAGALNAFAAAGVNLGLAYLVRHPMASAPYHHKSACMSVNRVHGWKMPAANAVQFEVIYKADDSGEVAKLRHEAVRQPDGTWLFTR